MRANAVVVFVGRPRTGKTTEILNQIHRDKKKVLIYDLNNEEKYRCFPLIPVDKIKSWRSGKYRVFTDDAAVLLDNIAKHVRNATVVLEDATSYIDPTATRLLKKILVSRRHWNIDLFLTFHSLNVVPPIVFEMCNYVVLKKTNDAEKKMNRIDKLPNPQALLSAWVKVMKSKNEYETITVQTNV